MFTLKDKVILITGAGSGIGAASAQLVASLGAKVAICGIPSKRVESTAQSLLNQGHEAMGLTLDVTDEEQVKNAFARVVERWGRVDVVVANAGIQRHRTDRDLYKIDLDEWETTQDVNSRGVIRTVKHGLAQMIKQETGGSIIIMSSITGLNGRTPNVSYMTAKTGLLGLNKHIAVHYAKHGIRCNAICPGALEQTPDWDDHPDPVGRRKAMESAIPLGRLGRNEDIAPWVAFLSSDQTAYTSGAVMVVDGGMTVV